MTGRVAPASARGRRGADGAGGARLGPGIGASALLHAAAVAALLVARPPAPPPAPPVYRVNLVAAPPGPRAIGVVDPRPPAPAAARPAADPTPTPPAPRAAAIAPPAAPPPPKAAALPKPPPRATPLPPTKATPLPPTKAPPPPSKAEANPPAKGADAGAPKAGARPDPAARPGGTGAPGPRAGGGPQGGRGTDVANVDIRGLDFPYPGYLANIVRQVAVRFSPPNPNQVLHADVAFLIHRDGSISGVRVVRSSRNYAFDLEARGAVEAAGSARAFGPLPENFRDDVLPVTFSFDPRIIR